MSLILVNPFFSFRYSCSRRRLLHLLGAVPRTAPDDRLHPRRPVDPRLARDPESSLLRFRYTGHLRYIRVDFALNNTRIRSKYRRALRVKQVTR